MAFSKIQTVSLASNASEIEFTAIPSTYKDLYMLLNVRCANATNRQSVILTFNNNTSGYARARGYAYDSGPTLGGDNGTSQADAALGTANGTSVGADFYSPMEVYIFSYASSAANKTFHSRFGAVSNTTSTWVNGFGHFAWTNSAAINSIKLVFDLNNFVSGSTASLYGIS